jgi:hypothetical protein
MYHLLLNIYLVANIQYGRSKDCLFPNIKTPELLHIRLFSDFSPPDFVSQLADENDYVFR